MTDRPRQQADAEPHEADRLALRLLGATQAAALAGDVMGSLRVLLPDGGADLALGVGATHPLLPAPEQTAWGGRTHSFVVTPRHPGLFVEALPGLGGSAGSGAGRRD